MKSKGKRVLLAVIAVVVLVVGGIGVKSALSTTDVWRSVSGVY